MGLGQMKSWLSSPLITNYLLSLYQNGAPFQKKYVQIYNSVKVTQPCKFRNKLFLPSSHNVEKYLKTSDIEVENVPFENNNDASKIINNWGVWKSDQLSPVMKVHNSFSYTEDIKYEARLLELPMEDDFRLAVVVPNEVDSLHTLYKTLTTKGLDAAITCVQPLFTHTTVLEAPSIEFSSEGEVVSEANCDIYNGIQLGNVQINENGTNISLLTCSTYKNHSIVGEELSHEEAVYYFAIIYKDTAIFTGRYVKEIK